MKTIKIQDKDFDPTGDRVDYVLTTSQDGESFAVLDIPTATPVEIRMTNEDGLSFVDYRFSTDTDANTGLDTLAWCKEFIEECIADRSKTFIEVALQKRVADDEMKPIKWFCGEPD